MTTVIHADEWSPSHGVCRVAVAGKDSRTGNWVASTDRAKYFAWNAPERFINVTSTPEKYLTINDLKGLIVTSNGNEGPGIDRIFSYPSIAQFVASGIVKVGDTITTRFLFNISPPSSGQNTLSIIRHASDSQFTAPYFGTEGAIHVPTLQPLRRIITVHFTLVSETEARFVFLT
jgi:hypothetical protein